MGIRDLQVTGYHPGVLSGLALSGANASPAPNGDDGILTALEVASMDLSNVEVAVLSACETGLGEVAGGEGVLGLQRAFQVAGVRTTVTSLWKVPDVATQLLMQRFYENLWDRGMGKLEALRQAQLWLMREGGRRGVSVPGADSGDEPRSLPPYYWAGFVLSGDWR
jgi:CHAT domain-containing protein